MNTTRLFVTSLALLGTLAGAPLLRAADEPKPPQPPVNREALREQLKNLSPEERQAKIRELRERQMGTNRVDIEKRRAEFQKLQGELKGLPPEERQAKIQQWRQTNGLARPGFRTLEPDQVKAKRGEMKGRIEQQLTELRKKKADGTITEQESKRLERMELMAKRLEQGPGEAGKDSGALPPPVVPPKPAKPPGGQ
jgi:hypothetical protein